MKAINLILLFFLCSCGGKKSNGVYPYTGITSMRIDQSQPDNDHNGVFHVNYKMDKSIGGDLREMTARGLINGDFAELIVVYDKTSQEHPNSITWNRGGSQGSPQYSAKCVSTGPELCDETIVNPRNFQFIFRYQKVTNTSPSNDVRIYGEIYLYGGEVQ